MRVMVRFHSRWVDLCVVNTHGTHLSSFIFSSSSAESTSNSDEEMRENWRSGDIGRHGPLHVIDEGASAQVGGFLKDYQGGKIGEKTMGRRRRGR